MKYLLKGVALGLTLNTANRICASVFEGLTCEGAELASAVIFAIIITAFLVSDNPVQLFICGFTGLFTMFFGEIFIFSQLFSMFDPCVYIGGFYGSVFAVILAVVLTVNHFKPFKYFAKEKDEIHMSKSLKLRLMIYAIVSAISFSYLVLPQDAAISVPVFTVLQFGMLWYITPNKKDLFCFCLSL